MLMFALHNIIYLITFKIIVSTEYNLKHLKV